MDGITIGIMLLKHAGSYLKDNGGNEVVKKAAIDFYDWIKSKLSKPSQIKKVEALEANPEDDQALATVKSLMNDAIDDEELALKEIQEKAKSFEEVLTTKDPGWYQNTVINKTNTQTITGNGIVGIQDVSGESTININAKK